MRFSIRSLLAIMLLCGIMFPLMIGLGQVGREEAMREKLHNEIQLLRQRLALDDPKRQVVKDHQKDGFKSLRRLRDTAERQFATIQDKYGKIEPRDAGVVSLRTIPQLSLDGGTAPTVFRLFVPTEREVWLKYAVVLYERNSRSSAQLDQLDQPAIDTGYKHNGLYEVRLPPGERILEVHAGPSAGKLLPIEIRLDDQDLIHTVFSGDGVRHSGATHVSGQRQIDFDGRRELPWLLDLKIRLEPDGGSRQDAPYSACLWLSDRSSSFERFPQQENVQ
jgi:hypothetical protein